jgi:hypothetical protein
MRYLLFGSGEIYYAKGGAHDLVDIGDNLEEMFDLMESEYDKDLGANLYKYKNKDLGWWHIYDLKRERICRSSKEQPFGAPQ